MVFNPNNQEIVEHYRDFCRSYNLNATRIQTIWRTLDKTKREWCFKIGIDDASREPRPVRRGLEDSYKLIPEWNLKNITDMASNSLFDLLQYRSTTSLFDQCHKEHNGIPGDRDFIKNLNIFANSITKEGADANIHNYACFSEGDTYIRMIHIKPELEHKVLAATAKSSCRHLMIPRATAVLIIIRQNFLFHHLKDMISEILLFSPDSERFTPWPKMPETAVSHGSSRMTLKVVTSKPELSGVLAWASDQKTDAADFLHLLCTEASVLWRQVFGLHCTHPDYIPDAAGMSSRLYSDKHISPCVLESTHSAIKTAATWDYICRLLHILADSTTDSKYRAISLQELSNVCHLTFKHAQARLKRYVQGATGTGFGHFKRVPNTTDEFGDARVVMNPTSKLEHFIAKPQLHYLLRLCHQDMTASGAVEWMKKLHDFHRDYPLDHKKMNPGEVESLGALALIVAFTADLSQVVNLPPFSRKSGQEFVSRQRALQTEMNSLKESVDLLQYVVPVDNLLEPGVAGQTLAAMEQFVVERTGTKISLLYQDMVDDCTSAIAGQGQKHKATMATDSQASVSHLVAAPCQSDWERVQWRKEKEKTRPTHKSIYELTAMPDELPADEFVAPEKRIKVSSATADVFTALFDKSLSRGSVSWVAFESALAELGFSVRPTIGSAYTFCPPDSLDVKRPVTFHRPHQANIEGRVLLNMALRLKRVYGWSKGTFVVA